jgi:threonine/homoserine/homoserine lactone efflux protein
MDNYFLMLLLGLSSAMIGAVPFGLVNLTVLNTTFERGSRAALKIAHGASIVEVLFGLTALFIGGLLARHLEGNSVVSYATVAVLLMGGLFFLSKKQRRFDTSETGDSGILKEIMLNLVSLQVFLFWILAVAFLSSKGLLHCDLPSIVLFLTGIWLGKMAVLVGMAFYQFFKP